MYHDIKVLNVFLASPGDLLDERQAAREVVEEINLSIGRLVNWRIELLGWEDTTPGFSRPQTKINQDVDRCELFVGVLWKRWGQPPGNSDYQSGFEEEFTRAKDRRTRGNSPEIWLFLKTIESDALLDPGAQLKRVIAFREKLETEKLVYFKEFRSVDSWTREFRKSLTAYLVNLSRLGAGSEADFPNSHLAIDKTPTRIAL